MDNTTLSHESEAQISDSGHGGRKRGGWITFPFIIVAMTGLTIASGGWQSNLIVYLIEEFNVKSIDAAQISNVVAGCTCLFPIIGAIIADSFFGCFTVITVSSFISLMGIVLITLTSTIESLRPEQCLTGSSICQAASKLQISVLYFGIALAAIGFGGVRFTIATIGANQFDKQEDQAIFFNWYFFAMYTSSVISGTAIVYIEDNVKWGLGYGLCVGANLFALVILVSGKRFYKHDKPKGSPFIELARVIVASIRKRKLSLSYDRRDYYYQLEGSAKIVIELPKETFRFLNRAALKTEGDIKSDGSVAKPWRLCTLQQVEDFKTLVKIFPLWSTGIFLSTPIGIQMSLTILQALAMDRHLGPHFKIPAGSILVVTLISTSISLTLVDRFLCPVWQNLTGSVPTPLQKIGLGHVLNILSMAVSAIVESRRLNVVHSYHLLDQPGAIVPMLALWLFPQLILVGIGEAFHFPGQVSLFYQEFPVSLRSTATAMIALIIGIGFYLSTAIIDLVRRVSEWLPDNVNNGRLDNVYWMLVVVGVLNFGYYLVCARLYKYKNVENGGHDTSSPAK